MAYKIVNSQGLTVAIRQDEISAANRMTDFIIRYPEQRFTIEPITSLRFIHLEEF